MLCVAMTFVHDQPTSHCDVTDRQLQPNLRLTVLAVSVDNLMLFGLALALHCSPLTLFLALSVVL